MARRTCTSLSFASLLLLLPARALACEADEAALFSCLAEDQAHAIELCAVRDDAAGGFQSLQYRYGVGDKAELVFPQDRKEGKSAMAFAHALDTDGSYVWSLRFSNGGYTYRLFGKGKAAGVEVWRKKKVLAQVMCGEAPYASPAGIRRAAACDMSNPFGAEGCSEAPPQRK